MPTSLRNIQTWLTNLKTHINTDGPTLGQSADQVKIDAGLVDSILTPVSDAMTKQDAWVQADGAARTAVNTQDGPLREMLNRYKATTGFDDGMATSWDVKTHTPPTTWIPKSQRSRSIPDPGVNEIRGKKPGFTSVDIQMRVAATAAWTTIGTKISHFPFMDTTAPQTPGKPEEREYQAIGYVGDQQAGQPSDIVTGIYNAWAGIGAVPIS